MEENINKGDPRRKYTGDTRDEYGAACPQNERGSLGSDRIWLLPGSLEFNPGLRNAMYAYNMQPHLLAIKQEVLRAKSMYPENFNSHHEAYAVALEEMDELWDEVKKNNNNRDYKKMREEAVQTAAMIVRFLTELL